MIKVYVNGEWVMTFDNQEQVDNWIQSCDVDFLNGNNIEFRYDNE